MALIMQPLPSGGATLTNTVTGDVWHYDSREAAEFDMYFATFKDD